MSGLQPDGYDKFGPKYSVGSVRNYIRTEFTTGNNWIKRQEKSMASSVESSINLVEETTRKFDVAIDHLIDRQKRVAEGSMKASGSVRDAADKLMSGLAKVEKAADFDRLERYVGLLERAASAFTALAELEKTGKLEKIAVAIR